MNSIGVIGNKDSVMAYKALGLKVIYALETEEIAKAIKDLINEGCAIILITEESAVKAEEEIAKYKTKSLPAIILIPEGAKSMGLGMEILRKNVEKAVGINILND